MSAQNTGTLLQGNKTLITVGAMIAGLMAFLDISIVNVALNDIRANFGTPLDQIVWVSTAYAMANITIIPISGWLLKRFGFRRYYTFSIVVFTIASVLCGLSWNLLSLVIFRILQGIGGGAIIPTSQSVLFSRYPEKEHGSAGALFAIGAITGPLLGPTVGGYLVEWSSWHWIFFLNLPLGIIAAIIAWTQIKQPSFEPDRAPVDVFGIVLLAVGMVSLQYVLEEGNRDGWFESTLIVILSAVAAIALIGFISHELETKNPVADLRVFADRGYAAATGLNFLIGTAIFAGSVVLSLYCGNILHYRPLVIGKVFLQGAWIQLIIFPIIGRIVTKVDPRFLMVIANTGICLSLWLSGHLTADGDMRSVVIPYFVRCVGTGFGFVPLTLLAVSTLPPSRRAGGTALFSLTRELGASIGTAMISTMLDRESKKSFTFITSHVDAENLQIPAHGTNFDLAMLNARIGGQSLLRAFNNCFLLLAAAFLVGSLLILLMKKPAPRPVGASTNPEELVH